MTTADFLRRLTAKASALVLAPSLRGQIDTALARDGIKPTTDAEAVNALVNAYHGYKTAYETVCNKTPEPGLVGQVEGGFHFDGLHTDPKVIHNHDFMKDPRYIAAYDAGIAALQLDHKMYWRLHAVLFFANRGLKLEGDFVECGVWRGFLSAAIADYVKWGQVRKQFYLFDTFEGLAEDRLTPSERANTQKIAHLNSYFKDSFGGAKAAFAKYSNIHLIKGFVPDTLTSVEIDKVAYLSLDMNNVNPELAAAEYFWDRMVSSAPIILDDYGFVGYEEQKRGFDAFAKSKGVEVLHLPTGQGVILKP
jgi:hypothetical protein